jgi:hypothetical protein
MHGTQKYKFTYFNFAKNLGDTTECEVCLQNTVYSNSTENKSQSNYSNYF